MNDPDAKAMDEKDQQANQQADDGNQQEAEEKGGKGGVDPATGETLLPLPEPSGFCQGSGQALSDGTQNRDGSCSSQVQGQIPSVDKMISTIITSPKNGETISKDQDFKVTLKTNNMETGFFDDAQKEYYTQPQTLTQDGRVKGHQHVTIQNIGDGNNPPDANEKAFFKGVNEAANGAGELSVDVPPLNTTGQFRICTMTGSFSHQPVIMPIAQRGAQDDCIRVNVE